MQMTSTLFDVPRAAFLAARPILLRSLWKEYRMLRGFWCGVGALALLEISVVRMLEPADGRAEVLMGSAWAAAAFYAVGAAITLFAVEREEQTVAFLQLLPRRTWGLLAGKVLTAAATAFLLAGVLLILAHPWPAARQSLDLSLVGATAVLQFLAWGVFMSLLCPQPLLAAVLAIGAASLGMQLVVAATADAGTGLSLLAYRDALGGQLALAVLVGFVDVLIAPRWLESCDRGSRRAPTATFAANHSAAAVEIPAVTALPSVKATPLPRRRVFGRLFWQSWREGWKAMLAVVPVGCLLLAAESVVMGILAGRWTLGVPLTSTWFVIPALWGALVFRADQRGQKYRFLSEHAAPARLVWLARQAAWLVPMIVIGAALQAVAWIAWSTYADFGVMAALVPGEREDAAQVALTMDSWSRALGRWTALAWCGALASYGGGQVFSLLVRSPVLAGFAATALAVVINWWTLLAGFWRLPAWLFVAPIGLAALLASFAMSRKWLADRRGLRFWLTPAVIVALGVALVAVAVPVAREEQVPRDERVGPFARLTLETLLTRWQVDEPQAREVASRYEDLAARLTDAVTTASIVDNGVGRDGGVRPGRGAASVPDAPGWLSGPGYGRDMRRGWWASYPVEALEENQELFAEAAELSREPRCRFPVSPLGLPTLSGAFRHFVTLLIVDAERHLAAGRLDAALERILTLRRVQAHLMQYQRAPVYGWLRFGALYGDDDGLLLRWATAPGQTSQRVQRAVAELREAEEMFPAFSESVVADHLAVRRIVEGNDPPTFATKANSPGRGPSWIERFAIVANELPWERRRALAALAYMSNVKLEFADAVIDGFATRDGRVVGRSTQAANQRWRFMAGYPLAAAWGPANLPNPAAYSASQTWGELQREQKAIETCQTSLLPAIELGLRGSTAVDVRTYVSHRTRLTLERLALSLIAYRLDHGQLPETLAALAPEYIAEVPVDAFSLEAFEYHPRGFDLPLAPQEYAFEADFVPAGTPLIWSPGPTFAELQERWLARVVLADGASEIDWIASEQEARRQHAALNVGDTTIETPPQHVLLLPTMSPQRPYEGAILIAIPPAADEPSTDEEAASHEIDEPKGGAGDDSEE